MRLKFHRLNREYFVDRDAVAAYTVWTEDPVAEYTEEVQIELVFNRVFKDGSLVDEYWPRLMAYGDVLPLVKDLIGRDSVLADCGTVIEFEENLLRCGLKWTTPEAPNGPRSEMYWSRLLEEA